MGMEAHGRADPPPGSPENHPREGAKAESGNPTLGRRLRNEPGRTLKSGRESGRCLGQREVKPVGALS